MVRVFSVYQFGGQTIHRIPDDIRSACLIDSNHLVLAKFNHVIEIVALQSGGERYDLNGAAISDDRNHINYPKDNEIQLKFTFPTVDEVIEMVYCKYGNYIATIERKTSNQCEQTYCRIYANWPQCDTPASPGFDVGGNAKNTSSAPAPSFNFTIRARIAGRVTPSTNNANCLEVIEIPVTKLNTYTNYFNESDDYDNNSTTVGHSGGRTIVAGNPSYPHQLAVCQQTGTFICAIQRCIKLYKFIECTNESTHFKYIDFVELPFEIDLDFVPIYLSIDEHIVGCGNREFMCVFKLLERNYCNAADSDDVMSANSLTTSSELSGIVTINNSSVNHGASTLPGIMTDQGYHECVAAMDEYSSLNGADNSKTCLDYKIVSKKFLASIKANISSTFDHHHHQHSGHYDCDKPKVDKNRGSTELRPVFIENGVPLFNLRHLSATYSNATDEFYKDYVLKPLFQVKQHDAVTDPFRCLVMKPIYTKLTPPSPPNETGEKDHSEAYDQLVNIFKSVRNRRFVGISILLATVNDGYLYQFTNNEKWTISEEENQLNCLIATYPFTSPIIDVCITNYVIHALTDHGIETYTHRIGHKVFSSAYEYNLRDDPCVIEASPRVEEPICLIGLRPFLGIQRMLHTPEHLILLALSSDLPGNKCKQSSKCVKQRKKRTESVSNWTIYNLKIAPADVLYVDFMELAANHIPDSPKIYAHLLSEAHIILRIANEISFDCESNEASLGKTAQAIHETRCDRVRKLFLDSCLMLGDVFVMSQNRDAYCLAYPYYLMGKVSLGQVYQRITALLNTHTIETQSSKGAIYTLKVMIIKSAMSVEDMGHQLTAIDTATSQTLGEKLLAFFAKYAPNEIAVLGLSSSTFREFMIGKMCEVIAQTKEETQFTSEDKLCMILDSIRANQCNRIDQLLNSFNSIELYKALVAYWPILFDITKIKRTGKFVTTFSELTESHLLPAISSNKSIGIAILATFRHLLIDTNVLNIELILKLFMDYLAARFGQMNAYAGTQSILENILEAHFHRLYVVRGYSDSLSSTSKDACTKNSYRHCDSRFNTHTKLNYYSNNNNDSLCSQASSNSDKSNSSIATGNTNNSETSSSDAGFRSGKRLNGSTSLHTRSEPVTSSTMTANGGDDVKKLQHQQQHLFGSSFHTEALKLLIRIYLGALKTYTGSGQMIKNGVSLSVTNNCVQLKYIKFLRENFNKIYSNHVLMAATQCDELKGSILHPDDDMAKYHNSDKFIQSCNVQCESNGVIKLQKTPILFLSRRLSYLNRMPPIGDDEYFKDLTATKFWWTGEFDCDGDERRNAIVTVLKLQALLSSGKLTRDILQEIILFVEANTPFMGVDSFLTILLPFDLCIDYLIEMQPDYLLDYAKSAIMDDQKWQQLLIRITMQSKRITQIRSHEFYENLLRDHLEHLVHTKRLSEILNIFPVKYIGDSIGRNDDDEETASVELIDENMTENDLTGYTSDKKEEQNDDDADNRKSFSIKNSDYVFFTHYLKLAVDLDRSERLSEMIKTTGFQLYNTFIGGTSAMTSTTDSAAISSNKAAEN